jgi:hypothetical protein
MTKVHMLKNDDTLLSVKKTTLKSLASTKSGPKVLCARTGCILSCRWLVVLLCDIACKSQVLVGFHAGTS